MRRFWFNGDEMCEIDPRVGHHLRIRYADPLPNAAYVKDRPVIEEKQLRLCQLASSVEMSARARRRMARCQTRGRRGARPIANILRVTVGIYTDDGKPPPNGQVERILEAIGWRDTLRAIWAAERGL